MFEPVEMPRASSQIVNYYSFKNVRAYFRNNEIVKINSFVNICTPVTCNFNIGYIWRNEWRVLNVFNRKISLKKTLFFGLKRVLTLNKNSSTNS